MKKKQREDWRPIDGWPYEVSNLGRIRRSPTANIAPGRIVRPTREYVRVGLQKPGKRGKFLVHLLVAQAFLEARPRGWTANHKNGDKDDNRAENLHWLTRNENQRHAYAFGLAGVGEDAPRAKLTDEQVREIRREYQGRWGEQTATAKRYGVSQSLVTKIVRGEVWMHLDPDYKPKVCLDARTPKSGELHGRAKLTWKNVRAMRRGYSKGVSIARLAKRYEVAGCIARDIVYGKTWKHVQ